MIEHRPEYTDSYQFKVTGYLKNAANNSTPYAPIVDIIKADLRKVKPNYKYF